MKSCALYGTGAYILPESMFSQVTNFYHVVEASIAMHNSHPSFPSAIIPPDLAIDYWTWQKLNTQVLVPALVVQPDHDVMPKQDKGRFGRDLCPKRKH